MSPVGEQVRVVHAGEVHEEQVSRVIQGFHGLECGITRNNIRRATEYLVRDDERKGKRYPGTQSLILYICCLCVLFLAHM